MFTSRPGNGPREHDGVLAKQQAAVGHGIVLVDELHLELVHAHDMARDRYVADSHRVQHPSASTIAGAPASSTAEHDPSRCDCRLYHRQFSHALPSGASTRPASATGTGTDTWSWDVSLGSPVTW